MSPTGVDLTRDKCTVSCGVNPRYSEPGLCRRDFHMGPWSGSPVASGAGGRLPVGQMRLRCDEAPRGSGKTAGFERGYVV